MKWNLNPVLAFMGCLLMNGLASAQEVTQSPVGYWRTIDDKTGRPGSIVRIAEVDGELRGRIEKLLSPPSNDPDPICKKCPGDKQGKPVKGLEFLWGFKRQAGGWSDGYVLDPEEGRIYRGSMEVIDGGKHLRLFGYIRVIIKIGRSQIWERVAANAAESEPPRTVRWQRNAFDREENSWSLSSRVHSCSGQ